MDLLVVIHGIIFEVESDIPSLHGFRADDKRFGQRIQNDEFIGKPSDAVFEEEGKMNGKPRGPILPHRCSQDPTARSRARLFSLVFADSFVELSSSSSSSNTLQLSNCAFDYWSK